MIAFLRKICGFSEAYGEAVVNPAPAGAVMSAIAHPIDVNVADRHGRVKHAVYRIGAIERYLQQEAEAGCAVSSRKIDEFTHELNEHRALLFRFGVKR